MRPISALAGKKIDDMTIVVYALCSSVRGKIKLRPHLERLKVVKRAAEIRARAHAFSALGIPRDHIYLAGHSAGAWASLLVLRHHPDTARAAIAFAPAFAGVKAKRPPIWQDLRLRQQNQLSRARRIEALVFAFEGDAFNTIEDLAFFRSIPGIEFIAIDRNSQCGALAAHNTAFSRCFMQSQSARILAYIRQSLGKRYEP